MNLMLIWAICKKDLLLWLKHPVQIVSSLLVPISYFIVVILGAQAVGQSPVAIVNQDRGEIGSRMVQSVIEADVFRVTITDAQTAQKLYTGLQVAAVMTLPPDFSQRIQAHQTAPIHVLVNNFNLDLTNDIRRAIPESITTYYTSLGNANPITVTIAEHPLRAQNVELYQYSVLPVIILIITVSGVIASGMATTTEFEQRTMKVLLLAPCNRTAIIGGKVLAGFLITFGLALSMLVLGAILNLTRPQGLFWLTSIIIIGLCSLLSAGLGVAVGSSFQRKQVVSYTATLVAVELFALAGGLGVVFFEPDWLQRLAAWDPLTYGIHSLQQAVFYQSSTGFFLDVLVLAGTALAAIVLGSLALRREIGVR